MTPVSCFGCAFAERYRGRLVCLWFRCSAPFARHDESQCGPSAKQFERAA